MNASSVFSWALIALAAPGASAQALPALVAKVYPGAVAGNMKAGKSVPGGYGEGYHDPYCFLTKDSADKVREFYAREGVKLDPIPVKKDQNASGDGVHDLEEAVRLQLIREETGSIFAGPVEFKESRDAGAEPSNFNAVIVITGKARGKYPEPAKGSKADIFEDTIFFNFVTRPETAAFMNMGIELGVDPDRLIPIANRHIALQGSFFKKEGREPLVDKLISEFREKRSAELAAGVDFETLKTQENKAKAIDALFAELEKGAYPTLIMIQKSGSKAEVTRNPAIVSKEWRSAIRSLQGK